MVTFNSLLQAETTDENRGRVFATSDAIWQLGPDGLPPRGGWLADVVGIAAVYAFGGAPLLVTGAVGLARARPSGTT